MIPTATEVQGILRLLGNDHRQVAETLAAKGIRGNHQVSSCPISNYLAEQFPGARVYTDAYEVTLAGSGFYFHADLPFPSRAFVTHFDGGDHPELES